MNSTHCKAITGPPQSALPARLLLVGLLLFSAIHPVAAESPSTDLDPVIADIVEMLAAGVDEEVILQWLDSTGRRPSDIDSKGLIALTEAEASDEFVKALLTGVEETVEVSSESGPPPVPAASAAMTSTESGTPVSGETGEAVVRLRAKRVWVDEDEPDRPREPRWGVFLYLDGEFVSWTWPTLQGESVEVGREIDSGPHEMRVVLQRYEELRAGWFYESLAVPTLVGFDAQGGAPIEIDVEMRRIWGLWRQRKDGGPLSFVIRQGDRILAENDGTGGDPNRWQPVCEDVEANFPDADGVPKRFRNPMSRCIRWMDLWTGVGQATDRKAILETLAAADFQPPIR